MCFILAVDSKLLYMLTLQTKRSTHTTAREARSAAAYSPYGEVPVQIQSLLPAPPRAQRTSAPSARRNVRRIQSAVSVYIVIV